MESICLDDVVISCDMDGWIALGTDGEEMEMEMEVRMSTPYSSQCPAQCNAPYDEAHDVDELESSIDTLEGGTPFSHTPLCVPYEDDLCVPYEDDLCIPQYVRYGIALPSMTDAFDAHDRSVMDHILCNGCTTLLYDEGGDRIPIY